MRSDTGTRTPAWLLLLGAAALVVLIVWAASRWADRTEDAGFATGEPITVEGCLTARPDGAAFVLTPSELNPLGTALSRSAGEVRPTFTYELVGDAGALRPHVGQLVSVTGTVAEDVEREAEVDREQTTAPAAGDGSPPPEGAQVETSHEAEIQVRRMTVQSVKSTGQSCIAEPGPGPGAGSGQDPGPGGPPEP